MPARTRASRQCLPIQVPVCPHNAFVHLAWQIGAHAKMGKKTPRPGWQIGSVVSFILCEGAARGYLDTAAVRGALQESFVFQVLPSNSLNSPQIRHTVWGRVLTQVLDPSSAPSCNDALRNSDLKQAALPRAGSTCPYGCREAALNYQELGCVSRSKDGNKKELEHLLQPSRVPVAVVVSSNRDLAGPALAERRVFLAVAFLSYSNSHFTSFKQRSVGDCLQRLRQCTHI